MLARPFARADVPIDGEARFKASTAANPQWKTPTAPC